jgi:5-methyltetrahydrofolate--homocysteine methyltransferase
MSEILSRISESIIQGNVDDMVEMTEEAIDDGIPAQDILDKGLMAGMDYVGVEFKAGNMFVPEVLRSAKAMQTAMEVLKPELVKAGARRTGRVLIGTVKGDMHDIGKNLVGMMCEGAGFEVKDIGKDIAPDAFVQAVRDLRPDIVGMSALLTTTMRGMGHTIKALEEAGLRDQVKVIVGGAPVTQAFSDQIHADGYAPNAAAAADLAKKLVGAVQRG